MREKLIMLLLLGWFMLSWAAWIVLLFFPYGWVFAAALFPIPSIVSYIALDLLGEL